MSGADDAEFLPEFPHLAGAPSPTLPWMLAATRSRGFPVSHQSYRGSYIPPEGQPMANDSLVQCGTHSVPVSTPQSSL